VNLETPRYRGPLTAEQYPETDPWECCYAQHADSANRLAVVCVYWGNKYGPEYVRRLANAVRDNLKGFAHDFYCLTDSAFVRQSAEAWGVQCLPLPDMPGTKEGWWRKVSLFKPGAIPTCPGRPELLAGAPIGMYHCEGCGDMVMAGEPHAKRYALYLDLDVVVTGDLVELLRSQVPAHGIVMAENFGPNKPHAAHNSSVMLWRLGECAEVWTDWTPAVAEALHGDQCWIWRRLDGRIAEFPAELVRSYKYDCREAGVPPAGCRVVVFHGKPDPHEVRADWVAERWRTY
jgi:hypothetical protein